jgi:pyruvate/2-oxoglutarate/acetoin dehydrogenase E1 component
VLDPYGGAFKVTRGLSSAFPERVLTTPISEAAIVGAATGMALRGLRPIVEIMFGDFVTLIADQVINHLSKFRWMYNDQVRLPLVIRTPMGGRRGYGPTHSQTLEKLYLGVPGLKVVAPSALGQPGETLYRTILETEDPVLFVENKLLYLQPVVGASDLPEFTFLQVAEGPCPVYCLTIRQAPPPQLTLATYGYMAELGRQAALQLAYEREIFVELLVLTQLAPFYLDPLFDSVKRTQRLLTLEEGNYTLGWGGEVVARTAERFGPTLKAVGRLAARDLPVPASGPLEAQVLPDVAQIVDAAQSLVGENA